MAAALPRGGTPAIVASTAMERACRGFGPAPAQMVPWRPQKNFPKMTF